MQGSLKSLRHYCICLTYFFYYLANVAGVSYWKRLGPLPSDLRLGGTCRSHLQCLLYIPHSHCDWEQRICTCQPYHISYQNQTMCLPASLLGFGCLIDDQCTLKAPNSQCVKGKCQCQENHLQIRRHMCVPGAKLNDFCLSDAHCKLGAKYSTCNFIIPRIYGKCKCPVDYTITDNNECMPKLGSKCDSSEECEKTTANSVCQSGKCTCGQGYKLSDDKLHCESEKKVIIDELVSGSSESNTNTSVSPKSLGKSCSSSLECRLRDPFSSCINGLCECLKDSKECNSKQRGCYNDTFQCRNGQCISWYFVCDKQMNCEDGSDEDECIKHRCPKEAFQCNDGTCLSRGSVCNGRWECPDGSDEAQCYKGIKCSRFSHQCRSGQCVHQYGFCNGIVDCLDESDEDPSVCENAAFCPSGTHQCQNNKCRSTAILCSGLDGCGDNSDEDGCEVCLLLLLLPLSSCDQSPPKQNEGRGSNVPSSLKAIEVNTGNVDSAIHNKTEACWNEMGYCSTECSGQEMKKIPVHFCSVGEFCCVPRLIVRSLNILQHKDEKMTGSPCALQMGICGRQCAPPYTVYIGCQDCPPAMFCCVDIKVMKEKGNYL